MKFKGTAVVPYTLWQKYRFKGSYTAHAPVTRVSSIRRLRHLEAQLAHIVRLVIHIRNQIKDPTVRKLLQSVISNLTNAQMRLSTLEQQKPTAVLI